MNRLTKRAKDGLAYSDIPLNQSSVLDVNENIVECYTGFIADRLADYEDTGLEPEDILSNIKFLSNELNNALEKLAEYEQLEEQGLLIKLPCKVGDTVYAVNCNEIIESTVTEITLNEKGVRYIRLYSTDDRLADFKYDYFKKTVFLTREEAEKALEVGNE